jgi:signal transduction histidine kinase
LLVALVTYALHVRSHYDDLDRILITNAGHLAGQASDMPNFHLSKGSNDLEFMLRVYNADSTLCEALPGAQDLPQVDPSVLLSAPSGPAFDWLASLAPSLNGLPATPEGSGFGLISTAQERWRVYVLPLKQEGHIVGYIEALTPLGHLDSSIQTFRLLLVGLVLLALLVALLGSRAVAGRALRPLAQMTGVAETIALSQDFTHRITPPPYRDELGQLAQTFNEMLQSLEEAYRTQQRFVSDASHELRAPLTAIQGNLELLRRHKNMSETDREEALAEAAREAIRLTQLVADLLALARADSGIAIRRQPVELDEVVLEAFTEAHKLARDEQELALAHFEPVHLQEGDADRLKQLVLILFDNALKYTPGKGQVSLELSQDEDQALVIVKDNGIGISQADLPHVFERFYRADIGRSRDPGGTGLGLSIAKWIVGQHSGEIELESTPGQGTDVIVTLPLTTDLVSENITKNPKQILSLD